MFAVSIIENYKLLIPIFKIAIDLYKLKCYDFLFFIKKPHSERHCEARSNLTSIIFEIASTEKSRNDVPKWAFSLYKV
jgi:hypothetical protein